MGFTHTECIKKGIRVRIDHYTGPTCTLIFAKFSKKVSNEYHLIQYQTLKLKYICLIMTSTPRSCNN